MGLRTPCKARFDLKTSAGFGRGVGSARRLFRCPAPAFTFVASVPSPCSFFCLVPLLPWLALHCTAPHCTAPHCTAPHRTAPHRTAPHRTDTAPHRTAPHRTAPHCTAPHRTAPHCTRTALELDWDAPVPPGMAAPALVLGTDVAYCSALWKPCAAALAALCGPATIALVGVTRTDTGPPFFAALSANGLEYYLLEHQGDFALFLVCKNRPFFGAGDGADCGEAELPVQLPADLLLERLLRPCRPAISR